MEEHINIAELPDSSGRVIFMRISTNLGHLEAVPKGFRGAHVGHKSPLGFTHMFKIDYWIWSKTDQLYS